MNAVKTVIDRESWERGVRDGFATGRRGIVPDSMDALSYWSGFIEGEAARHGYEVSVDVVELTQSYRCRTCGKVSHHPMDLQHRYCAACHEFERG